MATAAIVAVVAAQNKYRKRQSSDTVDNVLRLSVLCSPIAEPRRRPILLPERGCRLPWGESAVAM